jgi:cytoskeletal protein CcmA (bactofilin family)
MFNNNRKAEGAHASAVSAEADNATFGSPLNPRNVHSSIYKVDPSAHSIVDEFLTMKGDLESDGDIHVKGKVLGNIRCKLLIIEIDALVEGGVEAEEVIVRGNTKGKIQADRVRLEKTANVDSEICHRSFSAEEGARIRGSLRARDDAPSGLTKDVEAKDGPRTKAPLRSKEVLLNGQSEAGTANAA